MSKMHEQDEVAALHNVQLAGAQVLHHNKGDQPQSQPANTLRAFNVGNPSCCWKQVTLLNLNPTL
jgi:hypothetical protein